MRIRLAGMAAGLALWGSAAAGQPGAVLEPPVRDRFVPVAPGVRLHVREAGRGPCVALLTGWTIPIDVWAPQLASLARRYRVLAIEPRGQGRSSPADEELTPAGRAADLRVALPALGARGCVVVGWSLGALDALAFTRVAPPGTLAGLVLVDEPVRPDTSAAEARSVLAIAARLQRDRAAAARAFVTGMFGRPPAPALVDTLVAGVLRTSSSAAIAMMVGEVTTDLSPVLPDVAVPVLVVAPAATPHRAEYDRMAAAVPRGAVAYVPGTGHALFRDAPARFDSLLAAFAETRAWPTPSRPTPR